MLKALVLICALNDAVCSTDTAHDVIRVPGETGLPARCFLTAWAFVAETSLAMPSERERLVVRCVRADR